MSDLARPTELVVGWSSHSDFCADCLDKVGCMRVTLRDIEACQYTQEQRRRDDGLMARGELPMLRGSAATHMLSITPPNTVVRRRSRQELEDVDDGPPWEEFDA